MSVRLSVSVSRTGIVSIRRKLVSQNLPHPVPKDCSWIYKVRKRVKASTVVKSIEKLPIFGLKVVAQPISKTVGPYEKKRRVIISKP